MFINFTLVDSSLLFLPFYLSMVRVFVTGANGYIGLAICRQLRLHGHTVYGLIRKPEYQKELQQIEVIPVVCSQEEIEKCQSFINMCSAVIDNVFDNTSAINKRLMNVVAKAGEVTGRKLKYIYTGGCLSYGDHPGKVLTEEDVPTPTPVFVWRETFGNEILKDVRFHGVIVKPGFVYGGTSGHYISHYWTIFADKDKIEVDGNPNKSWSWIHVDDNADAYRRIIEAPDSVVSGKVYNISDYTRATHRQIVEGMARTGGAKGEVVVVQPQGFFVVADISTVTSSKRIQQELGWYPAHTNFMDELEIYYNAYLATKK